MKTNKQNKNNGLESRSEQLSTNNTNAKAEAQSATAKAEKKDNRLPIDAQVRKENRKLPTPKVLNNLLRTLPEVYRTAEVVGKWVWVRFTQEPAAEIRQQLAQLGFHWNRERQAWQHPCGQFRLGSQADPREKYSSYFPARVRRSTNQPAATTA